MVRLVLRWTLLCFFLLNTVDALSNALSKPPFCVNLKCSVKPERRDDFIALIQRNQRLTLQDEPEALQYIVGGDVDDQNTFYIHKQFASKEAFKFHKETPHNTDWKQFKQSGAFSSPPITDFYDGMHPGVGMAPPVETAYCLNVQLSVNPEYRTEFLRVIKNNAIGSNQNEPLCLQYVWGEDCDSANIFHFHEEFTGNEGGKEGFEAHAVSPHFTEWEKFAANAEVFSKPPITGFYRTLPLAS